MVQREDRSQTASVKLHPSDQTVTVRLKELGEEDETPRSSKDQSYKNLDREHSRSGNVQSAHRNEMSGSAHMDTQQTLRGEYSGGDTTFEDTKDSKLQKPWKNPSDNSDREPSWLASHIRVKIIDKVIQKGRSVFPI